MASPRECCLPASWQLAGGTEPGAKLIPNEGLKDSIGHFKWNQGWASVPPQTRSLIALSQLSPRQGCLSQGQRRNKKAGGTSASEWGRDPLVMAFPAHPLTQATLPTDEDLVHWPRCLPQADVTLGLLSWNTG